MRYKIDEKDLKIIEMLRENGRIPYTEIAEKIGISDVAIIKRIRKLEEIGVIKKFTVLVDPKMLGYNVVAIVGVDTEPEKLFDVVRELKKFKQVKYIAISSGDHDIMTVIWAKDQKEYAEIHDKIMSMPGVKRVCPAIIQENIYGDICL